MKTPENRAATPNTLSQELGLHIQKPSYELTGLASTDRAAREEIQHRAYDHWIKAGRPDNRQQEHWLAAESEVIVPSIDKPNGEPSSSDPAGA